LTVCEILTRHEPYLGEDILTLATQIRDEGRTVLDQLPDNSPPYLVELIKMCCQVQISERPSFKRIVQYLDMHAPAGYVIPPEPIVAEIEVGTNNTNKKNKTNKANKANKTNKPTLETNKPNTPTSGYAQFAGNPPTNKGSKEDKRSTNKTKKGNDDGNEVVEMDTLPVKKTKKDRSIEEESHQAQISVQRPKKDETQSNYTAFGATSKAPEVRARFASCLLLQQQLTELVGEAQSVGSPRNLWTYRRTP